MMYPNQQGFRSLRVTVLVVLFTPMVRHMNQFV